MDLDVKTPETAMPENDNSKSVKADITINTTADNKQDVPTAPVAASESTEAPTKADTETNSNEAQMEPALTEQKLSAQPEIAAAPKIDATKPVPAGNILDTTKDGTETAKQVAADTQAENQKREEELAKLAQTSQPNPAMPTTDGIRGQSMAGMVQEMNATDEQSTPPTETMPTATETDPNANSQVQQPKKKSWWKFW